MRNHIAEAVDTNGRVEIKSIKSRTVHVVDTTRKGRIEIKVELDLYDERHGH